MSLSKYNDLQNTGKLIYQNNRSMRDIATIMEHPEFRQFFNKYFGDPIDIQNTLMLMKLYDNILNKDPYEKIAILFEAMSNTKIRREIIDRFINWKNNKETKCKQLIKY